MNKKSASLMLAMALILSGCSGTKSDPDQYNQRLNESIKSNAQSDYLYAQAASEPNNSSAQAKEDPESSKKLLDPNYTAQDAQNDLDTAFARATYAVENGEYDGTVEEMADEILSKNEDYQNYITNESNQDDAAKSEDEAHVQAVQTYSWKDFLEDMLAAREQAEEEIKRGEYSGSVEDRTNEILLDNELYQEYAAKISGSSVQLQGKTSDNQYRGIWVSASDYLDGSSNKVGNEWSIHHYASFDGTNYVEVPYGGAWYSVDHPVTLYVKTVIVEDDTYPDEATNEYSINIDTDKFLTSSGSYWTINQWTDVVENNGAYRGNSCTWDTDWTITFLYN